MKYYSEVLDTLFDSEEELNEAERISKKEEFERKEKENKLSVNILAAANARAEADRELTKLIKEYTELFGTSCVLEKDETGKYVRVRSREQSLFNFFSELY